MPMHEHAVLSSDSCCTFFMVFSSEFLSQTILDQLTYVQEACKHTLQLYKVQVSKDNEYDELKCAHEQLQRKLEEQSKEASEALQEKAKLEDQLKKVHHISQQQFTQEDLKSEVIVGKDSERQTFEQRLVAEAERTHQAEEEREAAMQEVERLHFIEQRAREDVQRLELALLTEQQIREQEAEQTEAFLQGMRDALLSKEQMSEKIIKEIEAARQEAERFHLALIAQERELEEMRHNVDRMRHTFVAEQERWRQDMANLQQRLDDAQAQAQSEQYSEPAKADITPWNVPRRDVRIVQEIGVGAWGIVARGVYRGQPVAVKWPHQMIVNQHTLERLERETQLMTQVRHPNLVRIVAAVFDEDSQALRAPPMIITELLDMNLRQCYEQGRLQGSSRMPIFKDVAYGLHYLHDRQEPIIHRDVSAPNVLLQALPAGMWRAKVSDFGSANVARLSKTAGEGAIIYMAPEAFPQTDPSVPHIPHTTKIDVFSYGILLCEVITARLPDPAQYFERLEMVRGQSTPLHGLIVSCTKHNPDNRPTIARVIDELHKIPQPRPRQL